MMVDVSALYIILSFCVFLAKFQPCIVAVGEKGKSPSKTGGKTRKKGRWSGEIRESLIQVSRWGRVVLIKSRKEIGKGHPKSLNLVSFCGALPQLQISCNTLSLSFCIGKSVRNKPARIYTWKMKVKPQTLCIYLALVLGVWGFYGALGD